RLARAMGFDNINMDIIAALPGETLADFLHTLEAVEMLAPDCLTVHTLARKRATRLHEDENFQPTPQAIAGDMVDHAAACARRMGMAPYYLYRQKHMAGNLENVGYAKPGKACRYNVDIMEETTSILAMGAGAISKRIFSAELRIERAPNVGNIEVYIARIQEMIARKQKLWEARRI
ncbi:MAG: coproporphyrinogen dehydrogenase HemZ, partial [Clostridia bacterium]